MYQSTLGSSYSVDFNFAFGEHTKTQGASLRFPKLSFTLLKTLSSDSLSLLLTWFILSRLTALKDLVRSLTHSLCYSTESLLEGRTLRMYVLTHPMSLPHTTSFARRGEHLAYARLFGLAEFATLRSRKDPFPIQNLTTDDDTLRRQGNRIRGNCTHLAAGYTSTTHVFLQPELRLDSLVALEGPRRLMLRYLD